MIPGDVPSVTELVTTIRVTHHVATRLLLDEADRAVASIAAGAPARDRQRVEDLRRTFSYFRDDLRAHLLSEERVVFPYMLRLDDAASRGAPLPHAPFQSLASPIQLMKNEQRNTEHALEHLEHGIALARRAGAPTPDWERLDAVIARLRRDLMAHVGLEQDVLFPMAVELERSVLASSILSGAQARAGSGRRAPR